ncbi:MAG: pentapeptide repeat-containing protein [Sedimentisphaerales bacterium]|nr:pentapeptide repeat-containing protein [Sedimentisphaerales bacterium]
MTDQNKNNENQQRRLDPELPKKGLRCDPDQYEMLKRCSDKNDITEWNKWREENPEEDVLLEGANIAQARRVSPGQEVFKTAYLRDANLNGGHLKRADLRGAHLEKANFIGAYLEEAKLEGAHLEDAWLSEAHLENANLLAAHLEGADLKFADVEDAVLNSTHLERASFFFAGLKGAYLIEAHLEGASFEKAIVDGSTFLWECKVDRFSVHRKCTNFSGVSLDMARIDPGTKQLLEYNIRRMNWEEWYSKHPLLKWPVRLFWSFSDYGISTWQVIIWFFVLAFSFAFVYMLWPSCVIVNGVVGDIRGLWHALYFSVVTMTTLGFGDIAANPDSWIGQTLLMLQVILGYVLLGALVTRFAVLFTAGGPAGRFADEKTIWQRLKEWWNKIWKKN